ncbi:MAG: exosome complex exonuclease Rrp41 [Candidatus Njordarchaeum guaymaensis]
MKEIDESKLILIDSNGIRTDGRRWNELRPLRIRVGILDRAEGSALVEMGKTKALATVYGPKEMFPKHMANPDRAILRAAYRMATFSVEERKKPQPSRRELELSKVIKEALEPAIMLHYYPRTVIEVYILILQADGGTRTAAINAASLALADAGIPMKGLVTAVAAGRVGDQVVLDLNDVEDKYGDADLPVAMIPATGEITLLQMDGTMSSDMFERALKLAIEGINIIYERQREALKRRFLELKEKILGGEFYASRD